MTENMDEISSADPFTVTGHQIWSILLWPGCCYFIKPERVKDLFIKHLAFTQQFRVDELQQPHVDLFDSEHYKQPRYDATEGTTL